MEECERLAGRSSATVRLVGRVGNGWEDVGEGGCCSVEESAAPSKGRSC